jgi:hypothetical protein
VGNIEVVTQRNFLHDKSHIYRAGTEPRSPAVTSQFLAPELIHRVPARSLDRAATAVGNINYFKWKASFMTELRANAYSVFKIMDMDRDRLRRLLFTCLISYLIILLFTYFNKLINYLFFYPAHYLLTYTLICIPN